MALVVPEYFLENYSCDLCGKFLSVLPVKIHYNRKLTCGRCVKSDDDGTDSIFNNLVSLSLFKCINRFDGCRMLLTSAEVVDHEDICRSKEYRCPLCPTGDNIATYYFPQHFQENHPENILLHSHLLVEMRDSLPELVYLYRVEDNLFVVVINNDSANDFIKFNVKCLKREPDESTQKFYIQNGKEILKTEKRLIRPLECEDGGYLFPKSMFTPDIGLSVILELNLQQSVTIIDGVILKGTEISSDIGECGVLETTIERREHSDGLVKCPEQQDITLKKTQKLCIKYNGEIYFGENQIIPYCYLCSEILHRYFKFNCNDLNRVYFLCEYCEQFARKIWNIETSEELIYKDLLKGILYCCSWGCGRKYASHKLREHEINCDSQPNRKCPVEDCEFLGNLQQIESHFDDKHKNTSRRINIRSTDIWVSHPQSGEHKTYLWMRDNFVLIRTFEYYNPRNAHRYFTLIESTVCTINQDNLEIVVCGWNEAGDKILLLNCGKETYQLLTQNEKTSFLKAKRPQRYFINRQFFTKCIVNTKERLGLTF